MFTLNKSDIGDEGLLFDIILVIKGVIYYIYIHYTILHKVILVEIKKIVVLLQLLF